MSVASYIAQMFIHVRGVVARLVLLMTSFIQNRKK